MIDFKNTVFQYLNIVDNSTFRGLVEKVLVKDEWIALSFQGYRDGVVFTDRRIITINVQGISEKKKDLTSIPYRNIQVFSAETAGTLDLDSELTLWIPSTGSIKLQFTRGTDIFSLCKLLSEKIL